MKKLGDFSKNVLTLSAGTALSQVINLLASLAIASLFLPEELGVLTFFIGVVAIGLVVNTGQYDQAIPLPKDDRIANALLNVAMILCVIVFGITLIFLAVTSPRPLLNKFEGISPYFVLVMFPLSVLMAGLYQTLLNWQIRNKSYKTLSINKLLQSIVANSAFILLGFFKFGSIGLLLGYLLGQLTSTVHLAVKPWRKADQFKGYSRGDLTKVAWQYQDFPKYRLPARLCNSLAFQMPVFMLAIFYNMDVVGWFALAQRFVRLPISLIGTSIGQVFFQEASSQFAEHGNCVRLYEKTLVKLLCFSIPFFLLLFLLAPTLFVWLFGDKWGESGIYVQLLTIMAFFQFLNLPLVRVFLVAEKQRADLVWQTIFVATSILSIYAGVYFFNSARKSLLFYALSQSLVYFLIMYFAWVYAKGDGKERPKPGHERYTTEA